jgi:DNA-binding response OmpR family regulator
MTTSGTRTPPALHEPLKVLIADDDPQFRQILATAVGLFGHSCEVACDGQQAWEMHLVNRADVILSDWKMPKMDGLALCAKIRSTDEPTKVHTYFVMLSGQKDREYVLEGKAAGADEYLTKPLDLEKLKMHLEVAQAVIARWIAAVLDETKDSN